MTYFGSILGQNWSFLAGSRSGQFGPLLARLGSGWDLMVILAGVWPNWPKWSKLTILVILVKLVKKGLFDQDRRNWAKIGFASGPNGRSWAWLGDFC